MATGGKSKVADAARCRRHPSHRHAAGVCPFCLSDRLSRLSAAAAKAAADASSSSSASSPRSSGDVSVASAPPACRGARRARLGMLMRQEEAAAGDRHGGQENAEEKKPAKRSNFWARLQQGRSWYRRDGCSLAHSKAAGDKTAKRAPMF
ncbi:uncharacterized protein LOC124707350 [Lolium rigidum]|uniref:uncharacterized protein LOC124707350 n=1 Tax=Lolium rigidum TaxID=89674 RepID=UPI001F5D223D|nr:uncharacterized protein LOC124707350 [Lolium rigidum]